MSSRSTILRELMNASILLALVSSLFYIAGISYVNAYLTEWGVEPILIKSNIQEVLVHGVNVFFVGGVYTAPIAFGLGVILYIYLSIALGISKMIFVRKMVSKIYKAYKKRQPKPLKTFVPPVLLQSSVRWSLQFAILSISLLVILLMFSWLIQFSSSQAVDRAKKEYSEFSSGKLIGENLFSRKKMLVINGIEKEGYILASSDNLVVLYLLPSLLSKERVLIIPLSSISEIKAVKIAT